MKQMKTFPLRSQQPKLAKVALADLEGPPAPECNQWRDPAVSVHHDAFQKALLLRPPLVLPLSGGRYRVIGNLSTWRIASHRQETNTAARKSERVWVIILPPATDDRVVSAVELSLAPLLFGSPSTRAARRYRQRLRSAGLEGVKAAAEPAHLGPTAKKARR